MKFLLPLSLFWCSLSIASQTLFVFSPSQSILVTMTIDDVIYDNECLDDDVIYDNECLEYFPVESKVTGRIWLDRNLGATQVAQSSYDHLAYGDLFQWGRQADGHQKIIWWNLVEGSAQNNRSMINADILCNSEFIIEKYYPHDWRIDPNKELWSISNKENNPCPQGYRVPTIEEWIAEGRGWRNAKSAYESDLKLPMPGYRSGTAATLYYPSQHGIYWSSTAKDNTSMAFTISDYASLVSDRFRANGFSIRCIKCKD